MPSYAVPCTLQIPVHNDEPREISAIATIEMPDDGSSAKVTLDADGADMIWLPDRHPVYGWPYTASIPTPGPTQLELDAELRFALGICNWRVL